MKQYNSTSKFDIAKRKQFNIPLSRKQIKSDRQRQNSIRDAKVKEKIEENKRDIFSDNFEPLPFNKTNGEYLFIPQHVVKKVIQ